MAHSRESGNRKNATNGCAAGHFGRGTCDRYILNEWPTLEDGTAYQAGKKVLLAAYIGKMGAEEARRRLLPR